MRNKKILVLSLCLLPLLSNCSIDKRFLKVVFDCNGGYIETAKDIITSVLSVPAYEGWTWERFITAQDVKEPAKTTEPNKFGGWLLNGVPVAKDYVITTSILVVANWVQ